MSWAVLSCSRALRAFYFRPIQNKCMGRNEHAVAEQAEKPHKESKRANETSHSKSAKAHLVYQLSNDNTDRPYLEPIFESLFAMRLLSSENYDKTSEPPNVW